MENHQIILKKGNKDTMILLLHISIPEKVNFPVVTVNHNKKIVTQEITDFAPTRLWKTGIEKFRKYTNTHDEILYNIPKIVPFYIEIVVNGK